MSEPNGKIDQNGADEDEHKRGKEHHAAPHRHFRASVHTDSLLDKLPLKLYIGRDK